MLPRSSKATVRRTVDDLPRLALPSLPLESTRIRRRTSTTEHAEVGAAGGPLSDSLAREIGHPARGRPIPPAVRIRYEAAFGVSFADVRLHTDSDVAQRVAATAFTLGHDIHFAPGRYRPDTAEGARTLAHELAHVVQQSAPVQRAPASSILQREWVPGGGGRITPSSSAYKRAFHAARDAIVTVPTTVGTIVRVDRRGHVVHSRDEEFARIDMQGFTREGWLNVQCQAGNVSMAGLLCPPDLPLAAFRDGLQRAIDGNCMYTWVAEEATSDEPRRARPTGPPRAGGDGAASGGPPGDPPGDTERARTTNGGRSRGTRRGATQ